jgi:DNA-3-methyladenine glycosylase II
MTVNVPPSNIAFDLAEAVRHLSERDEQLKALIAELLPFKIEYEETESPYEILMESIVYQSISGKAAATIFARIKALGSDGRAPTPEQMLKLPAPKLRKAGLSAAKVAAMKDLARKLGVKKGWSVAYGKKHMPKPQELLKFGERWRPYRTVASWYMWRAFERAGYKVTNKIRARKPRKRHKKKILALRKPKSNKVRAK